MKIRIQLIITFFALIISLSGFTQARKGIDSIFIDNSLSISFITPYNLDSVKKFEKIEISINLPDTIENKIENFTSKKSSNDINPFNPNEINIEAEFSFLNDSINKTYKRYGFYYEDFKRNGERWIKKPNVNKFRLRFTPDFVGNWKMKLFISIKNKVIWKTDSEFKVVNSNLSGFVKKSSNPHYLELDNKTFLPFGLNIPTPKAKIADAWSDKPIKMSGYLKYHNEMKVLKENGGNYFRLLFHPWSLELEFEKIGDYSNRMNIAWEMDQILEEANELGLYIHLNIQSHYPFENASAYSLLNWDWPDNNSEKYLSEKCISNTDSGYCYMRELGLNLPIEFLNNTKAKTYYKNKLRYYLSRYAYSTNIAVIELFSEINNVGNEYLINHDSLKGCVSYHSQSLYKENDEVPVMVYKWHDEMSTFIKEEMGYKQHLLGLSYAGKPSIDRGDSSYYAKNIDVISFNKYGINISKRSYIKMIDNYKSIGKPFFFSEIGVNNKKVYSSANYTYAAREIILSPFSGAAGSLAWGLRYNPDSVWINFSYISSFLDSLELNDTNWQVYAIDRSDYKAELYCFKNRIEDKAIGIITNSTYNYYSLSDKKDELKTMNLPRQLSNFEDIKSGNFGNALKIYKLSKRTDYLIEYYNIKNGKKIGESIKKSSFLGNLKLEHPVLEVENNKRLNFIGFKVKAIKN